MNFRLIGVLVVSLLLAGCADSRDASESQPHPDPFEGFNRSMFNFNYNVLDPWVLRPVAVVWRDYVPQSARSGLGNFFGNLNEPAAMVNSFLRVDPHRGMVHFTRFLLNSVLGMGGLIDVAGKANSKLAREEPPRFGGTLGAYGVGYGPYLTLPFLGPVTPREDIGNYSDNFYPALSWLTFWMSASKKVLETIETRAQFLDSDAILRESKDPYALIRNAYFQHHDFMANGGRLKAEDNPNASAIEDQLDEIDAE